MKVEVVQADFLNKPDVATQIARRWFDVDGVDAITDLPNTPTALAVARLGKEQSKIILVAEAATPELTTAQCSPFTMHMADDTNALAQGTAKALLEKGLKSHLQGAASSTTILPMLTRVATTLQGSGLETQRLDYTGGVLTLDVDARALADIDSLKQRLGSRGFRAEIVSANAQGGLIRGRLRVGEGT